MFEQDYIMRLINEIVRTILKLVFHVDMDTEEIGDEDVKEEYGRLLALVDAGKINEAENRLLEEADGENKEIFRMALFFYMHLNEKDNDFLEEHNYKREEIAEGLRSVSGRYGYEGLADVLLEGEGDREP